MSLAVICREIGARILIGLLTIAAVAATSPDEREITDPKSIVSASSAAASPVPIPELYFTRDTFGPAWSPDGHEEVFTTNLTGRFNLWKVSSAGGWSIKLLQSADRQGVALWSPDGM